MEAKSKRKRARTIKTSEEVESQRMTHIAVERNRRKHMNEHLRVLRSLMPGSYVQRVPKSCFLHHKNNGKIIVFIYSNIYTFIYCFRFLCFFIFMFSETSTINKKRYSSISYRFYSSAKMDFDNYRKKKIGVFEKVLYSNKNFLSEILTRNI